MRTGIYPGSFDPITFGHYDIIKRSSKMMDKLVIGVLKNHAKNSLFSPDERVLMIEEVIQEMKNVEVEVFDGLTVSFAEKKGAKMIVRGLRAVSDFEYELQMAQTNHQLNPKIDTMFLTTSVEYAYLSSSIVKEVARYGGNIHGLVPESVINKVYEKYSKGV